MPVEVRLFAALTDAADGARSVTTEAATVAALVAELGERFGPVMQRRLAVSSVLVDGSKLPVDDTAVDLQAAGEIALLPPFAGG